MRFQGQFHFQKSIEALFTYLKLNQTSVTVGPHIQCITDRILDTLLLPNEKIGDFW